MNNINYSGNWAVDISEMSREEWGQLVSICEMKSIKMADHTYDSTAKFLYPFTLSYNNSMIGRGYGDMDNSKKVTLLQMFNLLESPPKTAKQVQIEEQQRIIEMAINKITKLQGE